MNMRCAIRKALTVSMVAFLPLAAGACRQAETQAPQQSETAASVPTAHPLERERARALLAMLGALAAKQPGTTVGDGQLIHVRTEENAAGITRVHQIWLEPDGLFARRIVTTGGGDDYVFPKSGQWAADDEEGVAKALARLASDGPSLSRPTRSWIAGWPTGPAALLDLLAPDATADGSSVGVVDGFAGLMSRAWPLIAPSQREALFMALAEASSVGAETSELVLVGNREVYSIFLVRDDGGPRELLFDGKTGLPVGSRASQQVWSFWEVSVVDRKQ